MRKDFYFWPLLCGLLLLAGSSFAWTDSPKTSIAIAQFVMDKPDPELAFTLRETLRAQINHSGLYEVQDNKLSQEILTELGETGNILPERRDKNVLLDLTTALGVQEIVFGHISMFGQTYVIRLLLFDAQLKDMKNTILLPCTVTEEDLLDKMHEAAIDLLEIKETKPQPQIFAARKKTINNIYEAASAGDLESVRRFIATGAEIDAPNEEGYTALHQAAENGHEEVVEFLLFLGAKINCQARNGWSPLHEAAQRGWDQIVQMLLNRGAEVNNTTHCGTTPLYYAAQSGHKQVVKLLRKYGGHL